MVVAFVALLVAAASSDLSRPEPPTTVEVAPGLVTAPNPLTDAQISQLREQASRDRLRCRPRGCEAWRFDLGRGPMASGAVPLGNGLVLLMVGSRSLAPTADDSETDEQQTQHHRLLAIDPETGAERWSRPVSDYPSISGAYRWVRLVPGPDGGALVVSGTTVTAIDADGEQRWTAIPDVASGPVREVWEAVTTADTVLLSGTILDRSSANHHLTAVDPASGAVRWTADVGHIVATLDDRAVVVDPDGTLRGLDVASGSTVWTRPGAVTHAMRSGPWIAAQAEDRLHLVDPTTGAEHGAADGWLTAPLVAAGAQWIGILRAPDDEPDVSPWNTDTGDLHLVAFDGDARGSWSTYLGQIRPWWDCCPITVDRDAGIVTVISPVRHLHHDLATGKLVLAQVTGRADDPSTHNGGLDDPAIEHPRDGIEVARFDGGARLEVRTPEGRVTIRSGAGARLESLEPLVVADERELLGIRVAPDDDR